MILFLFLKFLLLVYRKVLVHQRHFKYYPNSPTRSDLKLHEYCPPNQVETEMQKLLSAYQEYESQGVNPVVLAAWLHHRFVQIHPFSGIYI